MIPQYSILVIEDDTSLGPVISDTLGFIAHKIKIAQTGQEALALLSSSGPFDLILSDINLPDINGLDLSQLIRKEHPQLPIIFLSARNEEMDVVLGLELGAEDYIAKPFRARELIARVKKVLNRQIDPPTPSTPKVSEQDLLISGPISLNAISREVKVHEHEIDLTQKEFDLLELLLRHPKQVFSRQQILDRVWSESLDVNDRVVDSHMSHIRTKIQKHAPEFSRQFLTLRSIGYQFKPLET
ncbi:DNA-binding response regulator [bacterium (Candidatus Blackallbacteria) CG17_big_fil_post_rev_8_21_14_2_50_48_46]|uniref:DNA-binding response regulator n=1 Tax=bacterium (Candidatus Blackallbacteria) CG17_big_fil_post_rev_8_21_14_2_50_48_46 TaxID=2014261 RepID=A0A2M7G936_9BACT|nr:MAG: DNA-binding response regulator [bacterium (Candidatus Blackallbacteria) CG18_big_fil_WC_8_21_14_2_50_49_26]PIW18632.1 MAG: DNA-binding response regulator [bacterium (Candidatus Blackallbacteria) CG17_big_fil_post_rev_8_21_14_2_50_48_46]PIW46382.1 MAG: DNA-binding response regulator [bacterium (Candidatus Blackallbacteria) CG13_big_fil_rev_8_21_14_2_50_49_14]